VRGGGIKKSNRLGLGPRSPILCRTLGWTWASKSSSVSDFGLDLDFEVQFGSDFGMDLDFEVHGGLDFGLDLDLGSCRRVLIAVLDLRC
jgi:hypothetical protein